MKRGSKPKLSPWQVSYIRRAAKLRSRLTAKAIAGRFGVSKATVDGVVTGRYRYTREAA